MLHPHVLHVCLKQFQFEPPQDRADHQQNLRPREAVPSALSSLLNEGQEPT